jgi:hypothetical protein
MYRPLQVFLFIGSVAMICGVIPIMRFLYFFLNGAGDGHIQSLVLGSTLLILGFITLLMGLVADLIGFNRKLTEKVLHRIEVLEEKLEHQEKLPTYQFETKRKRSGE